MKDYYDVDPYTKTYLELKNYIKYCYFTSGWDSKSKKNIEDFIDKLQKLQPEIGNVRND